MNFELNDLEENDYKTITFLARQMIENFKIVNVKLRFRFKETEEIPYLQQILNF